MTESDIQLDITNYLTSMGIKWTKAIYNSRAGEPDLICCFLGLYVGIEVKVPGEKPTDLQVEKLEDIYNAKGIAMYATSVEEVSDCLTQAIQEDFSHPRLFQNWIEEHKATVEIVEL